MLGGHHDLRPAVGVEQVTVPALQLGQLKCCRWGQVGMVGVDHGAKVGGRLMVSVLLAQEGVGEVELSVRSQGCVGFFDGPAPELEGLLVIIALGVHVSEAVRGERREPAIAATLQHLEVGVVRAVAVTECHPAGSEVDH